MKQDYQADTGEFPSQSPVTRIFDVFFDLRLSKLLSKQSWCRWFDTPSRWLWHQCNDPSHYAIIWSSYHIILSVMAYQPIMLLLTMHIAHIYSLKSYQSHHHSIQLSFHKSIASWHFCAHTHHFMPCGAMLCRTTWISISLLDCIKLCDVISRGKIVNIISNHIIHHTQLFQEVNLILTWFHISFVYRTW